MINNRLLAIANLINDNPISVIDVGSDHAYLSIYLIQNQICQKVINVEVNQQPLLNGLNNVKKANLESYIDFKLNNGLLNLDLNQKTDYVTISGMGASSIIDIISNNTHQKPSYYVVQANNDVNKLRQFLKENNYEIDNELVVEDNGIYYEVLKFHQSDKTNILNDVDIFIGPINKNSRNDNLFNYLLNKKNHISKMNLDKIKDVLKNEYKVLLEFLSQYSE